MPFIMQYVVWCMTWVSYLWAGKIEMSCVYHELGYIWCIHSPSRLIGLKPDPHGFTLLLTSNLGLES